MGFYFRKSINFGKLFRINFSKKGVGFSTGITGARLVIGPAGTYIHLGRNGVYYKKYLSKKNRNRTPRLTKDYKAQIKHPENLKTENFDNITDIKSADIIRELEVKQKRISLFDIVGILPSIIIFCGTIYLSFSSYKDLEVYQDYGVINSKVVNIRSTPEINKVNVILKSKNGERFKLLEYKDSLWFKIEISQDEIGYCYSTLMLRIHEIEIIEPIYYFKSHFYLTLIAWVVISALIILWLYYLKGLDIKRKGVSLYFEFDDKHLNLQKKFQSALENLKNSKKAWQITNQEANLDPKYSGGAVTSFNRISIPLIPHE